MKGLDECSTSRTAPTEFLLLLRRLGDKNVLPVRNVLELGWGAGYSLRLWSQVAERVTGADVPQAMGLARRLLDAYPPPRHNIDLVESRGEDFTSSEKYDLVLTQYVLEHVDEIPKVLARIRENIEPQGLAIQVLNNTDSRTAWYVEYRQATSLPRRLYHSWRERGFLKTALGALEYTVPHEPRFGSFAHELTEYRLDRWALRLMRAGFEVVDWFQTADFNYVIITRPIAG